MGLVKQQYSSGKMIYVREIIGQFYYNIGSYYDKYDDAVYIHGSRHDLYY